jgi:hypothetical protein
MDTKLLVPCSLYYRVFGVYMADRDDNLHLKEKLARAYDVTSEQISCKGCLSDDRFVYLLYLRYPVMSHRKKYTSCHECDTFPYQLIDDFLVPVGKKVILKSVPIRKSVGTKEWVKQEEIRYSWPNCSEPLFRGTRRCASCKTAVEID